MEKCVNEETLSKDCQDRWNIVITEKQKLSESNKLIICTGYPINNISTEMLTQQRSNKIT